MPLDVIGAGFGRTGTSSLRSALELLGLGPCYHMDELNRRDGDLAMWEAKLAGEPVDLGSLLGGYRSALDWPVCSYWKELADRFPSATVILSTREPQAWYESMMRTVVPLTRAGLDSDDGAFRRKTTFGNQLIFERTFGGRFEDRTHALKVFEQHHDEVRQLVEPDRLLVLEPGDGWPALCDFLGLPHPPVAYPRRNARDDFWRA